MSRDPFISDLLTRLRRVVGESPVSLHEPRFAGQEWAYVKDCLDTGWVSSVGAYVDRFEADLAAYTGSRHAVATVNGTAALHICLALAGVRTGDEVLVPTLTFIATANAVHYCGAIPHFVDSEPVSLGVDAAKLDSYLQDLLLPSPDGPRNRQTGRVVRALMVMHVLGHPADLDALAEVCARHGLVLIEDAAEALGSFYKGGHIGRHGRLSALSFNGNKIITTGGGGAVLTQDAELARHAKHLTTTARVAHAWRFSHDEVGYNYRMPNINAALGCAQLEALPDMLADKRRLAGRYAEALATLAGASLFPEPAHARGNLWLNALILDPARASARDDILAASNTAGIMTRPLWTLMHRLSMHAGCPAMPLECAEDLDARLVNLPSSACLGATGHA